MAQLATLQGRSAALGVLARVALLGLAGCAGRLRSGGGIEGLDVQPGGRVHATSPKTTAHGRSTVRLGGSTGAQLLDRVAKAEFVCIGERHDSSASHVIQHDLLVATDSDRPRAVGLEMVAWPQQNKLDRFGRGKESAEDLAGELDWPKNWGFDFGLMAPIFKAAQKHNWRLLGLNVPKELPRHVGRHGLESLPAELRHQLPDLDLSDRSHRKFFRKQIVQMKAHGGHGADPHDRNAGPHGGGKLGHLYEAQVLWDETMADGAATWLRRDPTRQLVLLAGNGHCHQSAVAARVQRRLPHVRTVTILTGPRSSKLAMPHAAADFIVRTTGD